MGRTTRWLKGLFGIKNRESPTSGGCYGGRDKKLHTRPGRWICDNPDTIPPNITPAEAAWLRSCHNSYPPEQPQPTSGNNNTHHHHHHQQTKHAIAVAAATAAAADAAVAAAQAAAEVVRLTSQGRRNGAGDAGMWAAVKIQTTFRGYLARKALRALKGLVKIQALVRGYLVRKQATATYQGMQALIRAQTSMRRSRRAASNHSQSQSQSQSQTSFLRCSFDDDDNNNKQQRINNHNNNNNISEPLARRSMDIYADMDSVSNNSSSDHYNNNNNHHLSSSVLHSRRLSASFETCRTTTSPLSNPNPNPSYCNNDDDPKVVEVDTGRPRYRQHYTSMSELGEDPSSYQSSLLPPHLEFQFQSQFQTNRLSLPNSHQHQHQCCRHYHHHPPAWEDEYIPSPSTAQTTPRFSRYGAGPPVSPGRKDPTAGAAGWEKQNHFYYYNHHPGYMANTQSFKAKVRSYSAPRQRPDPNYNNYYYYNNTNNNIGSSGNRKKMSLNEVMMARRSSLSGVRMQRTCSQARETVDFRNAVMGRLGSPFS